MIQDRRGVSAIIYGLCAAMLIGFLGMSVDLARAWSVRSRLQTAVDAAVLMAAREPLADSMPQDAQNLFLANYKSNAPGALAYIMGSNAPQIATSYNKATNTVTSNVSATVPTTFIQIVPFAPKSLTISATASSVSGASGLEISLVLDNTGSMGQPDGSTGTGTVLQSLQASVGDLMNIVYGNNNDTAPDVSVAVVPFVASINVGNGARQQSWLTSPIPASQYQANNGAQYSWAGCVLSRWQNNDDEADTPPFQHKFMPYFADATYGLFQQQQSYGGGSSWGWGWGWGNQQSGTRSVCPAPQYRYRNTTYNSQWFNGDQTCVGDNDWNASYSVSQLNSVITPLVVGPNRGCPVPIMPLQPSKSAVMNMVNSLQTSWNGTIIVAGMNGGWLTLSPKWRGEAGWGDPVLPHNYMTDVNPPSVPIQKVIVLVSDGQDTWPIFPSTAPNDVNTPTSLYATYGRLNSSNNPLGIYIGNDENTLESNAVSAIDQRWMKTCSNIKAAGILIYVVGLGVEGPNERALLKQCATDPTNYYIESPTAAQLGAAFQQVGHQLSNLRLTQ